MGSSEGLWCFVPGRGSGCPWRSPGWVGSSLVGMVFGFSSVAMDTLMSFRLPQALRAESA